MSFVIAAIRTGHDPVGKLPDAAFHRILMSHNGSIESEPKRE